jgi:hypothetical protein
MPDAPNFQNRVQLSIVLDSLVFKFVESFEVTAKPCDTATEVVRITCLVQLLATVSVEISGLECGTDGRPQRLTRTGKLLGEVMPKVSMGGEP